MKKKVKPNMSASGEHRRWAWAGRAPIAGIVARNGLRPPESDYIPRSCNELG